MPSLQDNLQAIKARMHTACHMQHRLIDDVRLLAVAKTFPAEDVRQLYQLGLRSFGENYIQEAMQKMAALSDLAISWHLIGPIQSNKTKLVAEHFDWVESIDREKIARRLNDQRPAHIPPLNVCIQVNIDGGPNKSGVAPDEVLVLAQKITAMPRLHLRGVMFIPEPASDVVAQRSLFRTCKICFDALIASGFALDTLSMGMSADMEAAIAEGSTEIRMGTALFGARSIFPAHDLRAQ